mgnify:CR=1 FL=1
MQRGTDWRYSTKRVWFSERPTNFLPLQLLQGWSHHFILPLLPGTNYYFISSVNGNLVIYYHNRHLILIYHELTITILRGWFNGVRDLLSGEPFFDRIPQCIFYITHFNRFISFSSILLQHFSSNELMGTILNSFDLLIVFFWKFHSSVCNQHLLFQRHFYLFNFLGLADVTFLRKSFCENLLICYLKFWEKIVSIQFLDHIVVCFVSEFSVFVWYGWNTINFFWEINQIAP